MKKLCFVIGLLCSLGAWSQWKQIPSGVIETLAKFSEMEGPWYCDTAEVRFPGAPEMQIGPYSSNTPFVTSFKSGDDEYKTIHLLLGPSSHDVLITLQGKVLPPKRSGNQRWEFDITSYVKPGITNLELAFSLGDSNEMAWLAESPALLFRDLSFTATDNGGSIDLVVFNPKKPHYKKKSFDIEIPDLASTITLDLKAGKSASHSVRIPATARKEWCAELPVEGPCVISHKSPLGEESWSMNITRPRIAVTDKHILVNGKRERFQGVHFRMPIQSHGPDLSMDVLTQELLRLKRTGVNSILWESDDVPEALLETCDMLGLYVFQKGMNTKHQFHPSLIGSLIESDGEQAHWIFHAKTDRKVATTPGDGPWIAWPMADTRGNGLAGWSAEWQEMKTHPSFSGGFLSEWYGHAGPMDSSSRDITSGLFLANGKAKPAMAELSRAFERFEITWKGSAIHIENQMHSTSPEFIRVMTRVLLDGNILEKPFEGGLTAGPGEVMSIPVQLSDYPSASDVHLEVVVLSFDRDSKLGFPQTLARKQFELQFAETDDMELSSISWELREDKYVFQEGSTIFIIDANTGMPTSYMIGGKELFAMVPTLQFARSNTPLDAPPGGDEKRWRDAHKKLTVDYSELGGAEVTFHGQLPNSMGSYTLSYAVDSMTGLNVTLQMIPKRGIDPPNRLGYRFVFADDFQEVTWLGQGPHSTYPDRGGGLFGRFTKKRSDMYTPYRVIQESGSRGGWRSIRLQSDRNGEVEIQHVGHLDDQFTFTPLLQEELYRAQSVWPERPFAVLTIDDFQEPLNPSLRRDVAASAYKMAFRIQWHP